MLAADILRKFADRGIVISLAPDGKNLDITNFSRLTDDDHHLIKCYKTELLWRLKHPAGDPDPFVTTEACTVCGAALVPAEEESHRKLEGWRKMQCPAGCMSGYRRVTDSRPRIDGNGDLLIPFDAEAKYRWWQGGQSVAETLAELQGADAPIAQGRGQAD
jgi:hypothetical protein